MNEPYYSDDHVTIYHGDCLDLIPSLSFDVVVTDPPYGISLDTDRTARLRDGEKARTGRTHEPIAGDELPFDPAPFLHWPCVFTGPEHFAARLPPGRFHVWDKTGGGIGSTGLNNEFELVWTSFASGRSLVLRVLWAGLHRVNSHPDSFTHPTQKPLTLFNLLINMTPPGVVLDPFMGSGTTLRAAKDLGRKAIGIEIEERYCEIAARRMAQEVLPL